jgi:hypothetical protein
MSGIKKARELKKRIRDVREEQNESTDGMAIFEWTPIHI